MMTVKNTIFSLLFLLYIAYPLDIFAYYIIHTSKGNSFSTNGYWKERDKIMFYYNDGVMGINMKTVVKIEEKNKDIEGQEIYYDEKSDSKHDDGNISSNQEKTLNITNIISEKNITREPKKERNKDEKNKEEDQEIDMEYYTEKRLEIMNKIEEYLQQYQDSSSNRDKEGKREARAEMRKVSKGLFDLQDELKKKNKGVLPEWWQPL